MFHKAGALAALLCLPMTTAAFAQTPPGADDAVAAAKNQLGVLEFCQEAGHIDGASLEVQRKMMTLLPAATDEAKVEAAYQKGKEGIVAAAGVEQSLADAATAQGSDAKSLCVQISDMVSQLAGSLPK